MKCVCGILFVAMQTYFFYWYSALATSLVLSGCSLLWVLFSRSPESSGAVVLFYAFTFVLLYAATCLMQLALRKRYVPATVRDMVVVSNRQSALLSGLAVSLLYLRAEDLLYWWVAGTTVLLFICVEVFFNTQ